MTKLLPFLIAVASLLAGRACGQSCTANATGLAFGAYQPLSSAPGESTAEISISCTATLSRVPVSYTVQLSPGFGGSFANRRLRSRQFQLAYQVYLDPNYLRVWGDGAAGTSTIGDAYLVPRVPTRRDHTVYGRISPGQQVGIGTYSDILTVTIVY